MNPVKITIRNESQLDMGRKVESEHAATWDKIQAGEIKTPEQLYESIATEHLKEHPDYYDKLIGAGL